MTSLAEVYENVGTGNLRRLYLGTGLFATGALLVVFGIVIGTTDVLAGFGIGTYGSRRLAGAFAGLGVPAVFVGIFTVLPANERERATAAIGASVAVFGVALFWHVYPDQWYGATSNHLTLPVVTIYFFGTITTFWALFTAVTNFKTRNDPGGTIRLERTAEGEMRVVEVPPGESTNGETKRPEMSRMGSVGILGGIDRDAIEQPTTSDGGTDAEVLRSPDTTTEPSAQSGGPSDHYCGNCAHFDYTRTHNGIQPYCGYHDEVMDDMDPCEAWEPNTNANVS